MATGMAESIDINSYSIIPSGSTAGVPISNAFFVAGTTTGIVTNSSNIFSFSTPTNGNANLISDPSGNNILQFKKNGYYNINISLIALVNGISYTAGSTTQYQVIATTTLASTQQIISINAGGASSSSTTSGTNTAPVSVLTTTNNNIIQTSWTAYTTYSLLTALASQTAGDYTLSMVVYAVADSSLSIALTTSINPLTFDQTPFTATGNYTVQLLST